MRNSWKSIVPSPSASIERTMRSQSASLTSSPVTKRSASLSSAPSSEPSPDVSKRSNVSRSRASRAAPAPPPPPPPPSRLLFQSGSSARRSRCRALEAAYFFLSRCLGTCRRRTPRTRADLKVPKRRASSRPFPTPPSGSIQPHRRSPSARTENLLKKMRGAGGDHCEGVEHGVADGPRRERGYIFFWQLFGARRRRTPMGLDRAGG